MVDNCNIQKLTAFFSIKNRFYPNLGKKDSNGPKIFFLFFENFVISFSWEKSKMGTNIVEYFCTSTISGKILVLKLWTKMLLANQIAGFFKLYYLKIEVNVYFLAYRQTLKFSASWILSFWVYIARHARVAKITSFNNIFAVSQGKLEGWSWFFLRR